MNVSGISLPATQYQTGQITSTRNTIGSDFAELQEALQSNDLSGAQSAFTSIQDEMQNSGDVSDPSSDSSQLAGDFQAIGNALQSGNISSAGNAFATFQKDMQALMQQTSSSGTGKAHHHRHFNSAVAQQMKDLSSLGSAVQSGDTNSAESALSSLLQDLDNGGSSSSPLSASGQLNSDLQSLQSALSSGDSESAQSAYAALLQGLMPTGFGVSPSATTNPYLSSQQQSMVGNAVNVTA